MCTPCLLASGMVHMAWLIAAVTGNALDLLVTFGVFLIVYMIARFCNATPLMAMAFGVLPPLMAYIVQHPDAPTRLLALFS
jgi:hypothetical protein